jgi:hypothetical protein
MAQWRAAEGTTMKSAFLATAFLALAATAANAESYGYGSYGYETGSYPYHHYGSGYTQSHKTYVAPYRATRPPRQYYNYGSGGGYNSYTGQYGGGTSAY